MTEREASTERSFPALSGWPILILTIANAVAIALGGILGGVTGATKWFWLTWLISSVVVSFVCLFGYFVVNPNMSAVLVLFGRYRGTVRKPGLYWTNPFTMKHKLSLRAHNIASEKIKVNDLAGNPIEIGTVVVWLVTDTAQASFDVESYEDYVDVQIESAVRELAKVHPYDEGQVPGEHVTLRGDTKQVTDELQNELQARLARAGIEVLEARISHLAYAPEIASAMLQRQQASAIVAAREKIVEGAVGMVHMALDHLQRDHIVELDDERRATLVGNLLVVLCGQSNPTPVLNTGSLYN
jgi:regulator of protease activity HflC (stomatin/prohibitin superfamily)